MSWLDEAFEEVEDFFVEEVGGWITEDMPDWIKEHADEIYGHIADNKWLDKVFNKGEGDSWWSNFDLKSLPDFLEEAVKKMGAPKWLQRACQNIDKAGKGCLDAALKTQNWYACIGGAISEGLKDGYSWAKEAYDEQYGSDDPNHARKLRRKGVPKRMIDKEGIKKRQRKRREEKEREQKRVEARRKAIQRYQQSARGVEYIRPLDTETLEEAQELYEDIQASEDVRILTPPSLDVGILEDAPLSTPLTIIDIDDIDDEL
jgi:hypothetical protein